MIMLVVKPASGAEGRKQQEIVGFLPVGIIWFPVAAAYLGVEIDNIDRRNSEAWLKDGRLLKLVKEVPYLGA